TRFSRDWSSDVCSSDLPLAPRTLADDLQWREISGAGTLYSYTVATRPPAAHFASAGQMILAIVQWDEGPKFSTEIINADPEQLRSEERRVGKVCRTTRY